MNLGQKLRLGRKRLGLTQERLAELLGVSASAVWQWESPKHRSQPEIERLPQICDVLGISLDELLREVPDGWPETRGLVVGESVPEYKGHDEEERRALVRFRGLKPQQRDALLRLLETL